MTMAAATPSYDGGWPPVVPGGPGQGNPEGLGEEIPHGPRGPFHIAPVSGLQCEAIDPCLASLYSVPVGTSPGAHCGYCDAPREQSTCHGEPSAVSCTLVVYRTPTSPPGCGLYWNGTVNSNGDCSNGGPSTNVCYRFICVPIP